MIRRLLLLALLALARPAIAESVFIPDPGWVPPPAPTDYERVEAADRILLVRAEAVRGEQARFRVEESVKGELGKVAWLHARAEAAKGSRYLVYLSRNEDEWVHSDLGFMEVEDEDEDFLRVLRLFAGIAVLDDEEQEKKALRELREAALADPGRYPVLLVRLIDEHFGTPTLDKSFSDLLDLYDAAANDVERLNVLWALRYGEHPETAAFFPSLLLGGEPLWLMRPVLEWMSESDDADVPLLRHLVRVWLGHSGEDRTHLLGLMLGIAEPEDAPLLWSLLPSADLREKAELLDRVLRRPDPDRFVEGLRLPPDEGSKADLFVLWMGEAASGKAHPRLEALLRKEQACDWRSAASLEELLSAFEGSREPAERREILMEVERRLDRRDDEDQALAALWRLLRQASPREAEALLFSVYSRLSDEEKLAAFYRAVSGEEEKNRALWLLLAALGENEVEPLLSAAGALGDGSVRLERVARAFLTCPSEAVRLEIAGHFEEELAAGGDFLTMLQVLEGASLAEARLLAPWFARHPGPEALSILWRLPIPSLHEDGELAQALAAAGDPEVVDLAIDLRRRFATQDDEWIYAVLARSPLPAAQEEARRILEDGGLAHLRLLWKVAEEDNASPWREWYLREVADSEILDESSRSYALSWLAKLSEPEER